MKKSYLYFLLPLAGVAAFAAVYWQHASGYEEKLAQAARVQQEQRAEKVREENLAKKAAVDAALKAQEERKQAKAAKEKRDAEEKEKRELAVALRSKTRQDASNFQEKVRRLQKEVEDNKKEISRIEEERKIAAAEEAFLRDSVKQAKATTVSYQQVLERIEAADKAAAEAAKAAEAAAKAAKK